MSFVRKIDLIHTAVPCIIGGAALACGNLLGSHDHFVTALTLILLAVVLYFYYACVLADKNWLDIRAVFSGAWIGTIGLAALRLTDYQEPWQNMTWVLLGAAYSVFILGATMGISCGEKLMGGLKGKGQKAHIGKLYLKLHEERLFWCCVITTLIGFACFVINVMIRGYIPCFASSNDSAYVDFYTKFYVFAVAATGISGLCYYCLKTQKLSVGRRLILWLCILYSTFLFPTLVVSRGTFVTSALALTTVVFYLNRRKLLVLILCLVTILGIYAGVSTLRGYTDAQLQEFFEPSVIVPGGTEKPGDTEEPGDTEDPGDTEEPGDEQVGFQLSPKLAYLYSYLTVSHDNFNEAVQNTVGYTYGAKNFAPFNVLLRSEKIAQIIDNGEYYLVREHLTTTNLIGDFYYDFHGIGVVVFMLLWSFVFGLMQCSVDVFGGPFALLTMANAMTPVTLCFFATWLSTFSQWMFWGVVLLLAFAACITKKTATQGR